MAPPQTGLTNLWSTARRPRLSMTIYYIVNDFGEHVHQSNVSIRIDKHLLLVYSMLMPYY